MQAAVARATNSLRQLQEAKQAAEDQACQDILQLPEAVSKLDDDQQEKLLTAICQHTFCKLPAESAALLVGSDWGDHAVTIVYGNPDTDITDFSSAGLATWLCNLGPDNFTVSWPSDGEHQT